MKTSLEEIHRGKAARRKALAALPYEEKIRIMEGLQKMGRALIAARGQLRPNASVSRAKMPGRQQP